MSVGKSTDVEEMYDASLTADDEGICTARRSSQKMNTVFWCPWRLRQTRPVSPQRRTHSHMLCVLVNAIWC